MKHPAFYKIPEKEFEGEMWIKASDHHQAIEEYGKKMYEFGWSSSTEVLVFDLTHDFKTAFGADTLASIAAYIRARGKQ